jgi:hypothetical protein
MICRFHWEILMIRYLLAIVTVELIRKAVAAR